MGPLVCAGLVLAGCNSAVDRAGGGGDPQPTVLRMVNPLNSLEVQPFVERWHACRTGRCGSTCRATGTWVTWPPRAT